MLEHLRQLGKSSSGPADQAIGKMAEAGLIVRGGIDIPFPSIVAPASHAVVTVEKPALKTPETDLIKLAIAEYKKSPLTPELVDTTWQTLWRVWEARIGQRLEVFPCDRTSEELVQLQRENKAVLLIPDNADLVMLGKVFPKMRSWAVSERTTVTESSRGGSIDIEMDLYSPKGHTTENQAEDFLKSQGRDGQRLKTYIIGSQFSKLLTCHYFDEHASSRLPGSRRGGYIVDARFRSNGGLRVGSDLRPENHDSDLGFRSEGVKKA